MKLGDMLDDRGILKLLPNNAYDAMSWPELRLFCHYHARYGLPTVELVDWLRGYIGDRSVIEIGSGCGDLAFHLGVRPTDNRMQEWPDVKTFYAAMNQPVVKYPSWVEGIDAIDAIEKYKPQVVVASWVTEWLDPTKPVPAHGGNMYGVKEDLILDAGVTYLLIGNEATHGNKRIMSRKHETHNLPFLRSRGQYPELDRVYVWNGDDVK